MPAIKERLPNRRNSETVKVKISGMSVYLNVGEFENGKLGEIFINLEKEGDFIRGMMNCFCISISKGLQHGIPLEEYVDDFIFTRFEPAGMVAGHDCIATCSSLVDYIFRELAIKYLNREDLIQKGKE